MSVCVCVCVCVRVCVCMRVVPKFCCIRYHVIKRDILNERTLLYPLWVHALARSSLEKSQTFRKFLHIVIYTGEGCKEHLYLHFL